MDAAQRAKEVIAKQEAGWIDHTDERRVSVKLGDTTVAESSDSIMLWQFGRHVEPTYFFSRDNIRMEYLVASAEKYGKQFWTVKVGDLLVENCQLMRFTLVELSIFSVDAIDEI